MHKRRVLFICTGNSARSQMAEGLANHIVGNAWEAYSAGTQPSGYVHPLAIEAMSEICIDLFSHRSKSLECFHGMDFDVIVTVCDNAAKTCPVWLGGGQVIHIGFPDPAAAEGSLANRLDAFRAVRNDIRARVIPILEEFTSGDTGTSAA